MLYRSPLNYGICYPAVISYAIYEDSGSTLLSRKARKEQAEAQQAALNSVGGAAPRMSGAELAVAGRKTLTSNPDPTPKQPGLLPDNFKNDPKSKYFIVNSISELVLQEARKVIFFI